jgi:hypothetical protein
MIIINGFLRFLNKKVYVISVDKLGFVKIFGYLLINSEMLVPLKCIPYLHCTA